MDQICFETSTHARYKPCEKIMISFVTRVTQSKNEIYTATEPENIPFRNIIAKIIGIRIVHCT